MHGSDSIPTGDRSGLAQFILNLAADGRAVVSAQDDPGPPHDEAVLAALSAVETRARQELVGEPPPFSGPAALWAARLFYQACRCAVCRNLDAAYVNDVFATPGPGERSPSTDWSADLLFRHLPELFGFARHLSNADPLVQALKHLATAWPMSSVGLPSLSGFNLDSFIEHPGLRRLYADRIVAAGDLSRLEDPRVADLLRADLGLHRDLAPLVASRLCPIGGQ